MPLDRLLKDQVVDLRGKPGGDTCKVILQAVMRYFFRTASCMSEGRSSGRWRIPFSCQLQGSGEEAGLGAGRGRYFLGEFFFGEGDSSFRGGK